MANLKDYTKGNYKKFRILLRKEEDADILNSLNRFLDEGGTKVDWIRKLCEKLR